jgi:hypothetical protein
MIAKVFLGLLQGILRFSVAEFQIGDDSPHQPQESGGVGMVELPDHPVRHPEELRGTPATRPVAR